MEIEPFEFELKVPEPPYFKNVVVAPDVMGSKISLNDIVAFMGPSGLLSAAALRYSVLLLRG